MGGNGLISKLKQKKKKFKSLIFTSFFKKHKNAILVFRSLYHWTTKNLIKIKTCYSTAFLFSGTEYWFILYVWHRLGGEKPHNKTIKIVVFQYTVEGKVGYAPAVARLECGFFPHDPRGFWQENGYGLLSVFKVDWDRFGGKYESCHLGKDTPSYGQY